MPETLNKYIIDPTAFGIHPDSDAIFFKHYAKFALLYGADSTGRHNTFNQKVVMAGPTGWMKHLTGNDAMRARGSPWHN